MKATRTGRHQGAEQYGRNRVPPAPSRHPAEEPHRSGPDRLVVQEPAQVVGQLTSRGVPLPGLFLQALQADRLQGRAACRAGAREAAPGARRTTCSRVVTQSVPRNGGRPVSISYRITPNA